MWKDVLNYAVDVVVIYFIAFLSAIGVGFYLKYVTDYNLPSIELIAISLLTACIVVALIFWEIWKHRWGTKW